MILLGLAITGGCGPLYGIFVAPLTPPKTVDAEFDISDKQLLIWVDLAVAEDEQSTVLRREIAEELGTLLKANKAIAGIVDYEKVMRFRRQHDDAMTWPIQKLGQELGGDYVLYVLVNQLDTRHEIGQDFFEGHLAGACKLIESSTGQRVWPVSQAQRPFTIAKDFVEEAGPTYERRLIKDMSKDLAAQVGPCFYKHKVEGE
ncbi:MAG: hypothetical protein JW709_04655 [Sedimentisphaerales bacterium]|nr:hypothetical protein [Sedimentisphaerales bacterium]